MTIEGIRFDDNTIAILAERSKIAEHTIETVLAEYNVLALEIDARNREADRASFAARIARTKNPDGLKVGDTVKFRTGREVWVVDHVTSEGLPVTLCMLKQKPGYRPRYMAISRHDGLYYLNNLTRITPRAPKGKNQ